MLEGLGWQVRTAAFPVLSGSGAGGRNVENWIVCRALSDCSVFPHQTSSHHMPKMHLTSLSPLSSPHLPGDSQVWCGRAFLCKRQPAKQQVKNAKRPYGLWSFCVNPVSFQSLCVIRKGFDNVEDAAAAALSVLHSLKPIGGLPDYQVWWLHCSLAQGRPAGNAVVANYVMSRLSVSCKPKLPLNSFGRRQGICPAALE